MRKLCLFTTIVILLLSNVSAGINSDVDADYGGEGFDPVSCTGSNPGCGVGGASSSGEVMIEACGSTAFADIKTSGREASYSGGDQIVEVPKDLQCGIGSHSFAVYNGGELQGEGTVTVLPKNMDAHKGNSLVVVMDQPDGILKDFFLTDEEFTRDILVREIDSPSNDEIAQWEAGLGNIQTLSSRYGTIESLVDGTLSDGRGGIQVGGFQDGDCEDDPCSIGKATSTPMYEVSDNYGKGPSSSSELTSATPVSQGAGAFLPVDGEIIYANDADTGNGPHFFICRPGQEERVAAESKKYTCNQETKEWEEEACPAGQVGLNDEDGDGTEEVVAYYENDAEGCQTQTFDEWSWNRDGFRLINDPKVHTCERNSEDEWDCNNNVDADYKPQKLTGTNVIVDQWYQAGEMPVVEYGAYRDYFKHIISQADGETTSTDFVDPQNGWTTQFQTLHTAEQKYGTPQNEDGPCGPSSNRDQCLEPSWWNGLNMTSTYSSNLVGYPDESTAIDHEDNWIPANAGPHNDAVSDESASARFKGGFAGNCKDTNKWTYVEDAGLGDPAWECGGATGEDPSGSITGSSAVTMPPLSTTAYLPETDSNGEELSIVLFPFNNQPQNDRPDYLPQELSDQIGYYSDLSDSGASNREIEGVNVACWSGTLGDKPTDVENSDRAFLQKGVNLGSNDPIEVSGTVQPGDYTGHSCQWDYEVTDFSDPVTGGEVIELHKDRNSDYLSQMRENGAEIPE